MRQNLQDYAGVKALAAELGVEFTHRSHDHSQDGRRPLHLGLNAGEELEIFRNPALVGNVEEFCARQRRRTTMTGRPAVQRRPHDCYMLFRPTCRVR